MIHPASLMRGTSGATSSGASTSSSRSFPAIRSSATNRSTGSHQGEARFLRADPRWHDRGHAGQHLFDAYPFRRTTHRNQSHPRLSLRLHRILHGPPNNPLRPLPPTWTSAGLLRGGEDRRSDGHSTYSSNYRRQRPVSAKFTARFARKSSIRSSNSTSLSHRGG